MYGLRPRFTKIGTPIKKPWRIILWGVSFKNLHGKRDGSHVHGPCAGKDTRITQLYTEQIVKVILKGIKNQMLLNNAYGVKRTLRPKSGVQSHALTCIQIDPIQVRQECIDWQGFQFQQFVHCGSFRLKVKDWITELRSAPFPDPGSYWTISFATSAMASSSTSKVESEGKTLTGVRATHKSLMILSTVEKRGVASQLPERFTMYDEEDGHCTDVLKDKYTVLIGGGNTENQLFMTMTSTNATNLGALNTTHPPSNSFFEQLRKREVFLMTNQKRWSKKPKEDQKAGQQDIQDMYDMCADLKSELANLGYALRHHNTRYPDDREKQIIIQDVVRDWIEFRYDLPIERAAAGRWAATTFSV